MSSGSVICHVGREIFWVRPQDVEEIKRIREYCDQIALEKIEQLLMEKYPDQVVESQI